MAAGIEYWATDRSYPKKTHIQTPSFRKALHVAAEKAEKSGRAVNVRRYYRDDDGFWEPGPIVSDQWTVKVT